MEKYAWAHVKLYDKNLYSTAQTALCELSHRITALVFNLSILNDRTLSSKSCPFIHLFISKWGSFHTFWSNLKKKKEQLSLFPTSLLKASPIVSALHDHFYSHSKKWLPGFSFFVICLGGTDCSFRTKLLLLSENSEAFGISLLHFHVSRLSLSCPFLHADHHFY